MQEPTKLEYAPKADMSAETAWSYACVACQKCCYGKVIKVGPYEVLTIARTLGISTTEVIAKYTEAGGAVLRNKKNEACAFLNKDGCSVHEGRPLACRLYPLGMFEEADRKDVFREIEPHPQSKGIFGSNGTVADFLKHQKTASYTYANALYFALYEKMADSLSSFADYSVEDSDKQRKSLLKMKPGALAASFLDIDRTIAEHCEKTGDIPPTAVQECLSLHIAIIDNWLSELRGS